MLTLRDFQVSGLDKFANVSSDRAFIDVQLGGESLLKRKGKSGLGGVGLQKR